MRLLLDRLAFTDSFDGTLARLDQATYANAHRVQLCNDRPSGLSCSNISQYEFKLAQSMLTMCSKSSATDRERHEYSGILAQVLLPMKALNICLFI